MKIAHVNMFFYPTIGGVEQVMHELAKRQVKDGHEVHVYCCDSDKYSRIRKKYEIVDGIHIHRHRYWFRLSLSTFIWPGLLLTLPFKKFDIIHSHVSGHAYILFAGIASIINGAKHIHTTHCPWTDAFRNWKVKIPLLFTNLILNRVSYRLIDKVIAITPWELKTLYKLISKRKVCVIPNGMDDLLLKKIAKNDFKAKYKIKSKLVLFFGRLNPTKGPDKFVLAAKEILKDKKDVTFVIRGPDEGMLDTVKKLIGKEKRIILLEPTRDKKEIAKMYQAADVYVMPSYREGLPLTLFEAMASGLPIVASPVNGIPYEMEDNVNGLFSEYGNIKELKNNIIKILDNKKLAEKFSINNKKKAENYTWGSINDRYMKEYRLLLAKKQVF